MKCCAIHLGEGIGDSSFPTIPTIRRYSKVFNFPAQLSCEKWFRDRRAGRPIPLSMLSPVLPLSSVGKDSSPYARLVSICPAAVYNLPSQNRSFAVHLINLPTDFETNLLMLFR